MSHTSRLHRIRFERGRRQVRKLAFELLEDRQVLSAVYGPEPPKIWPSDIPGQCWTLAPGAAGAQENSLIRVACDQRGIEARSASLSFTQQSNPVPVTDSYSFSMDMTLSLSGAHVAEGSGNSNLGGYQSVNLGEPIRYLHRIAEDSIAAGPVFIDRGSIDVADALEQPASVTLGNPVKVADPPSPPKSLFSPERVAAPMTWSISPDAAQAIQRRFVVGSSDLLSFGPSRGAQQSLLAAGSTEVSRAKKSHAAGVERGALLQAGKGDADADLLGIGKSTRGWSRLASGQLRGSRQADFDDRIEIANFVSPTSGDATEIARDILFANLASREEVVLPPPAQAASPSDPSRESGSE